MAVPTGKAASRASAPPQWPRRCGLAHPLQHRVTAEFQAIYTIFQAAPRSRRSSSSVLTLETPGRGGTSPAGTFRETGCITWPGISSSSSVFPHQRCRRRPETPARGGYQTRRKSFVLHGPQGKPLIAYIIAEGAAVVAAPVGHLDDEAVGPSRGADRPFPLYRMGNSSFFLAIIAYFSGLKGVYFCAAPAS